MAGAAAVLHRFHTTDSSALADRLAARSVRCRLPRVDAGQGAARTARRQFAIVDVAAALIHIQGVIDGENVVRQRAVLQQHCVYAAE